MRKKKHSGFSLIEVIVGTIILAVAFGGLFAAFIGTRAYVGRANQRLVAINIARRALEDLFEHVREDNWDTAGNPLDPDAPIFNEPNYDIDGFDYNGNEYDVLAVGGQDYRQVNMNVEYGGGGGGGGVWF